MKRVFAAIDISEEVREEIRNYIVELRSGFDQVRVKWEKPEKLHITVKFAGSLDESQLKSFGEEIQTVAARLKRFQMKISGTGAFVKRRGPSVLWLGTEVVAAHNDPFETLSVLSDKRPFRPHLTIARIKDPRKARDLIQEHKASSFGSARFAVAELVIYESTLLPTGSVYTSLKRFEFSN
jgi:2'-5' RNA ligase